LVRAERRKELAHGDGRIDVDAVGQARFAAFIGQAKVTAASAVLVAKLFEQVTEIGDLEFGPIERATISIS
jgi:hypothetical protein